MTESTIRRRRSGGGWEGVEIARYKDEGSAPFRDITRQRLFDAPGLHCELRYFEIAPRGYSTLERHEHAHAVMILHGRGRCLVGDRIHELREYDLVSVPAWAWHQFRADDDAGLGFLCLVNRERDRPQLPGEDELAQLRRTREVAGFIRVGDDTGETPDG